MQKIVTGIGPDKWKMIGRSTVSVYEQIKIGSESRPILKSQSVTLERIEIGKVIIMIYKLMIWLAEVAFKFL
jgi:hypothetical protein